MMRKKILSIVLLMAVCILAGTTAFGGTPEFGRTQEEWSRIRDNTLEYDEIDALVKEYNPTVRNNAIALQDFKQKYGTTNAEVSDRYAQLAEELDQSVDLDPDSPMYAMSAMAEVSNETAVQQLEQQAENTVEDYEIYRLGYEQEEKTIAQKAKSEMIAYYNNQLEAKRAQLNVDLLDAQLQIKKAQADTGSATQVDVLKATEELLNAQKTYTQAAASVDTSKKKLQVACGWKYDENPVFAALPEPDLASIAAINPAQDMQKALDSNYTLRINQRKLLNARTKTTKDTLDTNISGNRQNIGMSLDTAYLNVTAARDAYEYSVTANEVQQKLLAQAEKQHEEGLISDYEYKAQKITAEIAGIAVQQAKYAVLEALMNYQYAVDGLAGA